MGFKTSGKVEGSELAFYMEIDPTVAIAGPFSNFASDFFWVKSTRTPCFCYSQTPL